MAYIINGKRIKSVQILTEPNSYQTNISPSDMQSGATCVSKGKVIVGTGKAFEFAIYGEDVVMKIKDEKGNEKYGIGIMEPNPANILFISSATDSDIIAQDSFRIQEIEGNKAVKIGTNKNTLENIYAFRSQDYIWIYFGNILNLKTKINFFLGKDSKL